MLAWPAVLCGNTGEACWSKYGSYPLHRPYCHEMALRILLASLEAHANRHKRYIVPVSLLQALAATCDPFHELSWAMCCFRADRLTFSGCSSLYLLPFASNRTLLMYAA